MGIEFGDTKMKSKMWSYEWWRNRLIEVVVALTVAILIVQISGLVGQRQRNLLPATAWFIVNDVFVPDHPVGSNPSIIYDRVIRQPFTGYWVVEVQRVDVDGLFRPVCSGAGISYYEPDESLDPSIVTWEWMIGRPCRVKPGAYRLRISYKMEKSGWPTKETFVSSNTFLVTDPEVGAVPQRR